MFWVITPLITICFGVIIFVCFEEFRKERVIILLYHRLRPEEKAKELDKEKIFVVYPSKFEEQIKYLSENGYKSISLDEYTNSVRNKKPFPPKSIIITFDDGYLSNYLYAYPILKKYGFTAVIFVTLDPCSEVFDPYREFDAPLTLSQMKEMSDSGVISIQSHGVTHRPLEGLSNEEIEKELLESKIELEKITKKPVNFLALAGAIYDKRPRVIAKQLGYDGVFTGYKGTNSLTTDPYCLRRMVVERDFTLRDFKSILSPLAACQWRIIGWLKSLFTLILGSKRAVRWRKVIYETKFGSIFTFKNLRVILSIALLFLFICALFFLFKKKI